MFQTYCKLIVAIVLILSQVTNSSEISSDEDPAKVIFTPMTQYLPFQSAGVVQCYIKSNPPLQYVTWTKDKRLLEPNQTEDVVIMNNGSLLFNKVNKSHQGNYTCTPYNSQGTQGSSGPMQVLVRKLPRFTTEPKAVYQRKVGETVKMHCEAQAENGTRKPTIQWHRADGIPLPKNRIRILGGNITIEGLQRSDFGLYQCIASNEVTTIVAATQLVVEETQLKILIDTYLLQSNRKADADVIHKVEVNPALFLTSSEELEPAFSGQKLSLPTNLTIIENNNGILIGWQPPLKHKDLVQYYIIMYKTDGAYRKLNKSKIEPNENSYLVKNLVGDRTYYFKVLAYTSENFESSDEIKYVVSARVKLNSSPPIMT